MKLIKPSEISAGILSLMDESDERFVIVSPYMKISKWYKFVNKINRLKSRKIVTEIYVREDPENEDTYRDLDGLKLEYKKIPHLHCKFYMNEKCGIVSSLNLLLSSEINSLEIGYGTETRSEYSELLGFFQRYIQIGEPVQYGTIAGRKAADLKEVIHSIREEFRTNGKNAWPRLGKNALHICTGSNYYAISINGGYLRILCWLRNGFSKTRKSISPGIAKKIGELTAMQVDIHPAPEPHILHISGKAPHTIQSPCIEGMLEADAVYIVESVVRFINITENLAFHEPDRCTKRRPRLPGR